MTRRGKPLHIDPKEFALAWQGASSLDEVAQRFKTTKGLAACRACYFRSKGVALKRFPGGPRRIIASELNAALTCSPRESAERSA